MTLHVVVVLLGMPAAGKSYHGRRLAARLGVPFVDGDDEIVRAEGGGATLAEILARRGTEGFRRLESRVLCSIDCSAPVVIAPGGSAVYCPEALSRFRDLGAVLVHLRESEATVRERIGDPVSRGVVMAPGMTFSDLFEERVRLCGEWADVTLDCARESDVVGALERMVHGDSGEHRNDPIALATSAGTRGRRTRSAGKMSETQLRGRLTRPNSGS